MSFGFLPTLLLPLLVAALALTDVFADEFEISEALIKEVQHHYGAAAGARMEGWRRIMKDNAGLSETRKLKLVNDFFNRQKFVNDINHWGKADFWATPVEFLASGGGDCEDFSIAKYYTLRQLGIPDHKLRITYVMALEYKQAHMVLSYFPEPGTIPLILDNLNKRILPADQRRDLKPVYNFNGDGLWYARQRGGGDKKVGKSSRVGRWMKLRKRFQQSISQTDQPKDVTNIKTGKEL